MNEQTFFNSLVISWFLLAAVVFLVLFFIAAPYGRHARSGWGPANDSKLGWLVMEVSAPLTFAFFFILGNNTTIVMLVFLGLWEIHYIHRTFIYPFSLRGRSKQIPITIIIFGLLFNTANGYLNGRYLFTFSGGYPIEWLGDPRFITGLVLFVTGFIINWRADYTLHKLRKLDESGYRIPYGKLYRWISCPNYLGEIIIWVGWAITTWSLPGLAFAVWTAANLVPRAWSHHNWYQKHFPDYPPERRALVPRIW